MSLICPQSSILSIPFLGKYDPNKSLQSPYVPALYRTLTVASVAALLLFAMLLASWVLDWRYASESTVDQNMKSLFPDDARRRQYLLEKIDEIDRGEMTRQQTAMRKAILRNLSRDAVMLEREIEVGAFD